jgi:hypothetical protein
MLVLGATILLTACGQSSEPAVSQSLAASSPVAPPTVVGPIEGGLRGGPLTGTVEALAPLAPFGFIEEEFFFSGRAESRDPQGRRTGQSATYTSRMLVLRPRDPARFNGSVVVEWFNNTVLVDQAPLWGLTHPELLREGYAWVGVSAQSIGVNSSPLGMKFWDPLRYAPLRHPGEAFAFDIFSQAGRALLARDGPALLGDLAPRRLIAAGESQSAGLLISYANQVQPEAQVFDGFFIHTWPGAIRPEVGVPVLMLLTEGEIEGFTSPLGAQQNLDFLAPLGDIPGLGLLRLPDPKPPADDHDFLRVWELAGGSHFDQEALVYVVASLTQDQTAPVWLPVTLTVPVVCVLPPNQLGLARASMAALHQLDRWIASGRAPLSQPRIDKDGNDRMLRGADGFVSGGVRMPGYAVPAGLNRGDTCLFFGSFRAFTPAEMRARYADAADYQRQVTEAAANAVGEGTLLPPEAEAYLHDAEAVRFDE